MSSKRDDAIQQANRIHTKARYSAEDKIALHHQFETILDRLESQQRGPDAWEEACLVHALSYMDAGLYDRAHVEVQECVRPVGERSIWREAQIKRNPQRYTLARLRLRFKALKAGMI